MLTDKHCKNAACPPEKKRARFSDAHGLYLEVSPAGSKRWFWKTYSNGKEGRLALGSYPTISLAAARKARDVAKLQKAEGVNLVQVRRLEHLKGREDRDNTFKAVALEWHGKQADNWSPEYAKRTLRQLERDLFPWLGSRLMNEIEPMELLAVLQKIEDRGALETADRALILARQVYEYWLPTASKVQRNITEGLKKRLTPFRALKFPAILDPKRFGGLLRAMHAYKGGPIVRTALLLAPLVFQRPGNLRMIEWTELDLEEGLWTIPSAKMKRTKMEKANGDPHVVPLPKQAVALLKEIQPITGRGRFVFPGQRDHERPMSDNSVRSALYSLGYGKEQSWHGFRASARTMMVDELDMDVLAIEANLAHVVKDTNGRSYNRTQYKAMRFVQIQRWADYLDDLREGILEVKDKKVGQADCT